VSLIFRNSHQAVAQSLSNELNNNTLKKEILSRKNREDREALKDAHNFGIFKTFQL
jgi:hypothetical protein